MSDDLLPVVTVADVGLTRRRSVILEHVDLTVQPGQLVVVAGPTGTGKTALLHLLAGIDQPTNGTITWNPPGPPRWRHVALVPQSIALIDELTVEENIDIAGRAARQPTQPTILSEILEHLDLLRLRHRLVDEISTGERQRTMIARALASSPTLLLADEPTIHQDADHASAIRDILRKATEDQHSLIIATRDIRELSDVADVVLLLG